MAIVTTLTFNSTAYDVSDYVMRHSIEIDEQLFNPDNLKPTTNRCDFKLSRSCPYIDELFAWTGDVEVSVVADGVAAFTGYLTDNYGLKITARGASDVSLSAEDPGIKKLKTAWVSTSALVTIFAGEKVCDPADTSNSFLHILAGLAGVTLATTLPTISDTVYFSVQDKDKKQYWDILEKVLLDYRHVFYFDATGKLALFALDGLTGTASQYVCTNGTILQKSPGDPGVEIKKRLIQYKEVIVNFDEGETIASATVFRDTTGQGLTDCEIEIAAGAYYPTSCDASTYAYIDYFLEDGREIKAVDSITADFSLDSGITYELTNLGTSAQIRFYNPTGLARSIRKLKITGANVLAIKADSKVTSTVAGGKKLEYDAAYITELADAQSLANLLRYYYANSGSLYTFRAYAGTLYPSDTLFPSDTLYPLGDIILLGDITRLHDPVWTGLDVNCGIYRKKYVVGKAGATFDAVGIGTINLADAVSIYPIYQPNIQPPSSLPEIQAIADAAQAAAEANAAAAAIAAIPVYTPQYLGAHLDTTPSVAKEGDVYLLYSATPNTVIPPTIADPPDHRGVFRYTSSAWVWTTDAADMYKAIRDIVDICGLLNSATPPTPIYGVVADYGVTSSIETAHIKTALIDYLRGGDASFSGDVDMHDGTVRGVLSTPILATTDPTGGDTINAPSFTHWAGSTLVSHCSTLADGWTEVDSASSIGSKTISHAVKSSSSTDYLQSHDAAASGSSSHPLALSITSAVAGLVTLYTTIATTRSTNNAYILVNGVYIYSSTAIGSIAINTILAIGDTITFNVSAPMGESMTFTNTRISPRASTVALWNSDDSTAIVYDNSSYYTSTGHVDLTGLADFVVSYTHWLGSVFINAFDGYVRGSMEQAASGTFNSKTVASVYIVGDSTIRITYSDTTTETLTATEYYDYTGSVVLPDNVGKMKLRRSLTDDDYDIWADVIPGTTDVQILVQNKESGQVHSIMTLRAPIGNQTESTHSQSCIVTNSGQYIDWVHDISLHNYAGVDTMKVVDVVMCLNAVLTGQWQWVRRRPVAGTAYGTYGTMDTDFTALSLSGDGMLKPGGGYKSVDDSTGATGSFTTADGKTVTVKNGLIVSIA